MAYNQDETAEFTEPVQRVDRTQQRAQKKNFMNQIENAVDKTKRKVKQITGANELPKKQKPAGSVYGYRFMQLVYNHDPENEENNGFRLKSPLSPNNKMIWPKGGNPGPAGCKSNSAHDDSAL